MKKEVISQDGTKVFTSSSEGPRYSSTLQIRSTQTNEVIKERKDFGTHLLAGFSQDHEKVLYLSSYLFEYIQPSVTVWDFEKGEVWSITSKLNRGIGIVAESHNDDLSIVLAACWDGEISLIRPYEKRVVWHRTLDEKDFMKIHSLKISEEEGVVWVFSDKGIEALSLEDGTAQSDYPLPADCSLQ